MSTDVPKVIPQWTRDTKEALDAIKLAADWSKWLVTIETAAIAGLGALMGSLAGKGAQPTGYGVPGLWVSGAAITAFVASIIAASLFLLSLPEIAESLVQGASIWQRHDEFIGIKIAHLALFQAGAFIVGIILFAVAVMLLGATAISLSPA